MLSVPQLSRSSEALLAARLLREEIVAFPVPPSARSGLRRRLLERNRHSARVPPSGPPSSASGPAVGGAGGLRVALDLAADWDGLVVRRDALATLAGACGAADLRVGPGQPFEGRPAAPPKGVAGLLDDLLERVNSPVAVEAWPPPARAYALGYLLRLVQPFAAPAEAVAASAEALLLAADGFACDLMLLPAARGDSAGEFGSPRARPDPDSFVHGRLSELPASLGDTLDLLRSATSDSLLLAWAVERGGPVNARQLRALRLLLEEPRRSQGMAFPDYVTLHAQPSGPSLRSLQRDWRGLRALGLLKPDGRADRSADERFVVRADATAFGFAPHT